MLRYFHELSTDQREVARSIHRDRTPQAHCYVVDLAGQILQAYELKPLFATGHVDAGDQVRTQLAIAGRTESEFAVRHAIGDWSEMSPDEQARNVLAIELGGSVLSRFALRADQNVYVVTDAQRSVTTLHAGTTPPSVND